MSKKLITLLLCVVLSLTLMSGCGSKDSAPEQAEGSAEQAQPADTEKELRIGELWSIASIDPSREGTLLKEKAMVLETLVDANDQFKVVPSLAKSWENTSESTWVFQLRDDVRFHDGTPFNAESVVWSLNNTIEKNPTTVNQTKIEKVEATGEFEVTITTSSPNPELPEYLVLANNSIIAPASYDADGNIVKPIGTGAFKVDNFDSNTGILSLVRNEDYYGSIPTVSKVTIFGMDEANTRSMALETGEIDFSCDLPFSDLDRLDALDNVRIEKYDTARVYDGIMNCNGIFADKLTRQAVSLAIDRETISKDVLFGVGTPAKGIFTDNVAWANTEVDCSTYDLDKAKELMAEAGWEDTDGDGILDKDGKPFEFTIVTWYEYAGHPLIAEALQSMLGELGMKVEILVLDYDALTERMKNGQEWGIYVNALATCMAPSSIYYLSRNYHTSDNSRTGYSNPEMDALIEACEQEFDTEKRYELSRQIQALALEDMPYIPICNYGISYGFNENIVNFKFNPTAHDYMWNPDIDIKQ